MSIALADLEQAVMDLLRAQPAFAGWKKRQALPVADLRRGAARRGADPLSRLLRQCTAPVPGRVRVLSVRKEWPVYVPAEIWNKGRLYRRAYLKPGDGLIDEPTLGSGAVLTIHNEQELANWLAALPADIENHLAPGWRATSRWNRPGMNTAFPAGAWQRPASSRMRIRRAEPAAYHHKRDSYPARSRSATRA